MPGVIQLIIIVEVTQLGLPVGLEPGQVGGVGAVGGGQVHDEAEIACLHCARLHYSLLISKTSYQLLVVYTLIEDLFIYEL